MPRRSVLFVALALVALTAAWAATALGAAPKKVYVEGDIVGQELVYRPHAIGLSGDGTFAMNGIKYTSYGGATATATARAYVRGCTPDCAQGKVYRPSASLRFETRLQCQGKTIYSELHYRLRGTLPAGFPRRGTESLRPVGPEGC
ncbi:MAG TPA: hypothetical protein VHB53_13260 [Solirubrobacterales bacterium]|nr:hypothetical protein [Solirubrobacterales bacterium]